MPAPDAPLPADQPMLTPGVLLGERYRLGGEIGAGATATVYLAQDLRHDRPVAIKVLRPDAAAILGADRFRREITVAAGLQHPNICSVFDSGEHQGWLWYAMPWVRGDSARARLVREGALPAPLVARIAQETARALAHAHAAGIVHRDVKPENILLAEDGTTLLSDFGIARAPASAGQARLTATGVGIGTPAYMAPEQVTGERDITPQADQYALAATCFELLTGTAPFAGESPAASIARRFTGPPPSVRGIRPGLPADVDAVFARALALEPSARFPSVQAFAEALATALASPSGGRPARAPWGRLAFRAGVLAVVLGLVYLRSQRHQTPAAPLVDAGDAAAIHLAILPFENLGDTADAALVDGITDAVRGKLTALPQLRVIARTSSNAYRGTHATPQEIGKALGVRFLLSGTVRIAPGPGGVRQLLVQPELVELHGDSVPTSRWQESFTVAVTDVFQVQAQLAGKVAEDLHVVMDPSARSALESRPTGDVEAWQSYQRALALTDGLTSTEPARYPPAIALLQGAVRRDSSFGIAWARLAAAMLLETWARTGPGAPDRRASLDSALARAQRFAPEAPETFEARRLYAGIAVGDRRMQMEAALAGYRRWPNNQLILRGLSVVEWFQGLADSAVTHGRRARALDPLDAGAAKSHAGMLIWARQYREAGEVAAHALALDPHEYESVIFAVMARLGVGDTAGARAVLRNLPAGSDPVRAAAWVAKMWFLGWIIEPDLRQRVLAAGDDLFDGDHPLAELTRAQLRLAAGDTSGSRAAAANAVRGFEQEGPDPPGGFRRLTHHSLALTLAGRPADAMALLAGRPSWDATTDAFIGHFVHEGRAIALFHLGKVAEARAELAPLLTRPYFLSETWLKVDPTFAVR